MILQRLRLFSLVLFSSLIFVMNCSASAKTSSITIDQASIVQNVSGDRVSIHWTTKLKQVKWFIVQVTHYSSSGSVRMVRKKVKGTRKKYLSTIFPGPTTSFTVQIITVTRSGKTFKGKKITVRPDPHSNNPTPTPSPTIMFPVRVFSTDASSAIKSVSIPLNELQVSSAIVLSLQIHGLDYPEKGSIQFNDSAWLALNNSTVSVQEPGRSSGGIGGAFSTLKMTLSLPVQAKIGTNTLRFRFNGTNGRSMGYRVLDINLLDKDGKTLLDRSLFSYEDPSTWAPPLTDTQSIAEGESLWRTATLNRSPLSSQQILAKCADCHAQDGRDLKYFNYSNEDIVTRAMFHGLTQHQGEAIASFIRTLKVPSPGRPWNPPYQPGPGIDKKPISEWSAGAGLENVLDNDKDTIASIFPNGITEDAVLRSKNLNVREIPIALQLPDWNHWLPSIHPKDAWGAEFMNSNALKVYAGEGGGSATWNLRDRIKTGGVSYLTKPLLQNATNKLYFYTVNSFPFDLGQFENFVHNDLLGSKTRDANGKKIISDVLTSEKVYSTGLWNLVKEWELMQETGAEQYGAQVFGSRAESRTWYTQTLFMVSPFMQGIPTTSNGINGNGLTTEYLSNAWYHLQLTLNDGNGAQQGTSPLDYPYVKGHIKDFFGFTKYAELGRALVWIIKGIQVEEGKTPDIWISGWSDGISDATTLMHSSYLPMWNGVQPELKRQLQEVITKQWFAQLSSFSETQLHTTNQSTYHPQLVDPTYVPKANYDGSLADKIMWAIPKLRASGVDPNLLNQMNSWAKQEWPLGNWNQ